MSIQTIYASKNKTQMPPKKRRLAPRKRPPPKVEAWQAIQALASSMIKLTRQEEQYVALLRQVADLTEHEAVHPEKTWFHGNFVFDEDIAKDIHAYVLEWTRDVVSRHEEVRQTCDASIETLRGVDVLDDEALKQAALTLTKSESKASTLDHLQSRWCRIVRFETGNLVEHTQKWLTRWLTQWKKLSETLEARLTQFKKYYTSPILGICES